MPVRVVLGLENQGRSLSGDGAKAPRHIRGTTHIVLRWTLQILGRAAAPHRRTRTWRLRGCTSTVLVLRKSEYDVFTTRFY